MSSTLKKLQNYELIGFANLSGSVPDFVLPVFMNKDNHRIYFQKGNKKKLKIQKFIPVKVESYNSIISIGSVKTNDDAMENNFDLDSDLLFAFQLSDNYIHYGRCNDLKSYLQHLDFSDDIILSEEISDFMKYTGSIVK